MITLVLWLLFAFGESNRKVEMNLTASWPSSSYHALLETR